MILPENQTKPFSNKFATRLQPNQRTGIVVKKTDDLIVMGRDRDGQGGMTENLVDLTRQTVVVWKNMYEIWNIHTVKPNGHLNVILSNESTGLPTSRS